MAKSFANVIIATDTFATWLGRTNQLCDAMSVEVITANTSVDGANTTGNTNLVGIFSANTIAAGNGLRGGTVNASANLTISSNAAFAGGNTSFSSNVYIQNDTSIINAVSTQVNGGTVTINSNTVVAGNLSFTGTRATFTGNVLFNSANATLSSQVTNITSNTLNIDSNTFIVSSNNLTVTSNVEFNGEIVTNDPLTVYDDINLSTVGKMTFAANTDLGASVGSPISVYSWARTDYSGASIVARASDILDSKKRMSQMLVVSSNTDVYMTEYATLHAPSSANLGVFSINSNTTHVILRYTQTEASESLLLNITLMA